MLFLLLMLVPQPLFTSGAVLIELNTTDRRGDFNHFWRSTGFCPPDPHSKADVYDLSNDMLQNLAFISAVPSKGIEQVRIHWLLSLVRVEKIAEGIPLYNFSLLDGLLDQLYAGGLKPGFEVMGNPSDIFTNFEDHMQVVRWKSLVEQVAKRYLVRYGTAYLETWNFESWNEPDCHDFDHLKMTVKGFLNYYDASSEGLKAANPRLIFGGPSDACGKSGSGHLGQYSEALMLHVVNGTNYFTGEKGVRMDFISIHRKGGGNSMRILNQTVDVGKYIATRYPSLARKPFFNNEADPLVGWNKDEDWRGSRVYAAMVAKVIAEHQNILLVPGSPVNYSLLGNDNGFLSYYPHQFTQRTLLARFQINNTTPHYTTFLQKAVYGVMGMLSLLGDELLFVNKTLSPSGQQISNDSYIGALATLHQPQPSDKSSDSWQSTLLMYASADTQNGSKHDDVILNWYIDPPMSSGPLMMASYFMSTKGPYEIWREQFNRSSYPTVENFQTLRHAEEPSIKRFFPVKANPGMVLIPWPIQLAEPEVVVMHLCAQPAYTPEAPSALRFIPITKHQVLVVWSPATVRTKCISGYDVEFSAQANGPFTRVNSENSIFTAFVYSPINPVTSITGWYRIRAVDYWNRAGTYSNVTFYSDIQDTSGDIVVG